MIRPTHSTASESTPSASAESPGSDTRQPGKTPTGGSAQVQEASFQEAGQDPEQDPERDPELLAPEGEDVPRKSDSETLLLIERLVEIERETGYVVGELVALVSDPVRTLESRRDAFSTQLMEIFRLHQSRTAFGLLFELNRDHLYAQVAGRLRRYACKADANDVLQEVFVNVYRYPHRFDSAREDAFRVWSATIVRNTVLKHMRSLSRSGRAEVAIDELPEQPEPLAVGPLQGAIRNESEERCTRVFVTYLHLYLRFYRMLSEREQKAIHLVEVEGTSYREAAAALGIKLENLKMVIFRARRKIHRSMRRVFEGLPPDVRPARRPRKSSKEKPALEIETTTSKETAESEARISRAKAGRAKDGVK